MKSFLLIRYKKTPSCPILIGFLGVISNIDYKDAFCFSASMSKTMHWVRRGYLMRHK